MYVIRKGSVRIFKSSPVGEVHLAVLAKGDFFGEMSVLENLPRDASAQALGETEVLVMTPGALLVRLRRDPTLAFELLRRLSGRVRTLNARLMSALQSSPPPGISENIDTLLYRPEDKDADAKTLLRPPQPTMPLPSFAPASAPPTSPSLQSSTDIELHPLRRPES
jgi:signal-transduction protein with cAMP-binding, CBS, and nucleotidyltransferase domain